jgi:thiamine biosynthesis lipoprotein
VVLLRVFRKVVKLMGNRFEISVVARNEAWANARIEEAIVEIQRIEKLLTTYSDDSETSLVNLHAGIKPVMVSREVFQIIQRSIRISHLTAGAFDLTYGSIDKKLWNFDTTMTALPDAETARELIKLIDYKKIVLNVDDCSVYLSEPGMRIGFGGIGKGYAADKAKAILQMNGVESGIVNAAGDLIAWGTQPNGNPWTAGIADPNASSKAFSQLNISNLAIATSGNYEKYALINGKHYSHTIDPRSGLPVSGIKSVTIVSPIAEFSDALATPVMVMGIKAGVDLVNQIKGVNCIILDDNNKLYCSKGINLNYS